MHGGEQVRLGIDRFEVSGRLGGGGGGVVYRAYDRVLRQEVAVKVMHGRDPEQLAMFRASFPSFSRLSHPNLVQLYELIELRRQSLLVMELVEGIDLLRYVRTQVGACDELRVRAVFGQLAQALCALHAERKVHRDVKPDNVRVTSSGRVVLLDLDFAVDLDQERAARSLGKLTRPLGTTAYIAPEQAASLRLTPACDWYSVGVVLYEALTGVRPYRGSDLEVLLQKQETRPARPRELSAQLPEDLEQLCVELVTPEPSERPSGGAILQRLGVDEDLLSARWIAASLLSTRPSFVGRESELAQIERALTRSREQVTVLRVSAHAGIGKTTLCEEALRRLAQREPQLVQLRANCPRYPEQPHAPLHRPMAHLAEVLRGERTAVRVSASALRLLERAFPGALLGLSAATQGRTALPPDPLEQRWRAIAALRAILAELASERPLLLWLDDYHWADVDTQRMVAGLSTGPDAPRMLLLLSEEPQPGDIGTLPPATESIALSKLSVEEARQLSDSLLARAGALRSALASAPSEERSPLLIQERVRHALTFGGELSGESFPELLRRRVGALSPESQRVLSLVCAAFDPLAYAVCESAAELPPAAFTRRVAELAMDGLVRHTVLGAEDALAPSHPLIAELVDVELSGRARSEIHHKLAAALSKYDAARASGRLLRHQGESGHPEKAAESAELSAEQAHAALAFQRAAELFSLRASLKPPTPDQDGHRLLRRMADALANAGWALSAATVYREAAQHAGAADTVEMQRRSVESLYRGAQLEEAVQATYELLRTLPVKPPKRGERALWSLRRQRLRTRITGLDFREQDVQRLPVSELSKLDALHASAAHLTLLDASAGADLFASTLQKARTLGEVQRMARALCVEAWSFTGKKRVERARSEQLLATVRALNERHPSPLLDGHMRLARGMIALASHEVRECAAHCRDAERVFRDSCAEAHWEIAQAQVHQLFALACAGSFRELGPRLVLYRGEADERGDVGTYTALLAVEALASSLALDAPALALAQLEELRSRWGEHETLHTQALFGLLAEGAIALYQDPAHAHAAIEARLLELSPLEQLPHMHTLVRELRARARLAEAQSKRDLALLRLVESEADALCAEQAPSARGFGHLLRANVQMQLGLSEPAVRSLEDGVGHLSPLGLGQWTLPAQLALGGLIGGQGGSEQATQARAQLEQQGVRDVARFAAMMLPALRAQ